MCYILYKEYIIRMKMTQDSNRRSDKRVVVDISCAVTLSNGIKIPGTAKNLSAKGMFVESSFPLNKGTEVTVNFTVPIKGGIQPIEAISQIEHRATRVSLGEYGIGVYFTEIDDDSIKVLDEYIASCPALH